MTRNQDGQPVTSRELLIILAFLLPPILLALVTALTALVLALIPREKTRIVRHKLAGWVMWLWKKMSRLSAIIHGWLWQRGNGH